MLKCWEADAKRRVCFTEIVAEVNELMNHDDSYYVLDNEGATNDGYVLDNPPNIEHTTTSNDGYIDPTSDYINPTTSANVTDDDYVNP